ncbi:MULTISPECIES: DUF2971 domain-containing protein [unclassified Microbacterium]|uniref:DUF2971 domain-containing protein n=1 Tax=unclassified Microbacterium TaxID=2609290 RepID=UPI003018B7E4
MEDGLIYHYTDASGLLGIAKSGKLWLTDVTYMNDRRELDYGIEVLREALKPRLSALQRAAALNPGEESPEGNISRVIGGVISELSRMLKPDDPGFRVFAACFCEEGDLLSQWRGYAKGVGGFSLGFDPDILARDKGGASPLVKVAYGPSEAQSLIEAIMPRIAPQPTGHPGAHAYTQAEQIVPIIARIKHPGFREEREHRLIHRYWGRGGGDLRATDSGLVSYVERPFDINAIRRIIVGPSADDRNLRAAYDLANSVGKGIEVVRSAIPFR